MRLQEHYMQGSEKPSSNNETWLLCAVAGASCISSMAEQREPSYAGSQQSYVLSSSHCFQQTLTWSVCPWPTCPLHAAGTITRLAHTFKELIHAVHEPPYKGFVDAIKKLHSGCSHESSCSQTESSGHSTPPTAMASTSNKQK
jgi:hypothetical protein